MEYTRKDGETDEQLFFRICSEKDKFSVSQSR